MNLATPTKLGLGICALALSSTALAATLVVDGDGGGDHTTISAAIAAATNGDTIEVAVASNPYDEQVFVDKEVTIIGTGGQPVVTFTGDGGDTYSTLRSGTQKPVFAIAANNVTIDNLNIQAFKPAGDIGTRRSCVVAQDNTIGPFDNLTVQNSTLSVSTADPANTTTWEHIGVYACSNDNTLESVFVTNNVFQGGAAVNPSDIGAAFASFFNNEPLFGKSMRFYRVNVEVIGNDSMGWFRDIHLEQLGTTFIQNNVFRNSVESTSARDGAVRVVGNRFTGEFYYRDADEVMFYDPDYAAAFEPAYGYTGDIPQFVAGYQDELLFLKANQSNIPYVIDNNTFVTRRFGINLGRSTDVVIRRNLFITDPSTDAPLPPTDYNTWSGIDSAPLPTVPANPIYPEKRHINIDRAWFATCCSGDIPDGFNIEIYGNDFEGAGAVAVKVTDEQPANNTDLGDSGDDFPADTFVVAGNDFDPDVIAFANDYDQDEQSFEVEDNFFGQAGGPLPSQLVDETANQTNPVTSVDDVDSTNVNDTDGDGLYDGEEITIYGTDPNNVDSDNDGFSDAFEVALGFPDFVEYDPNDENLPTTPPVDADNDGIPDDVDLNLGVTDIDTNNDGILDSYAFTVTGNQNSQVTLGDVDVNGVRDNVDAIQMLEVFLGLTILTGTSSDYDVNRDGVVDNVDAVITFNFFLGNVPYLPFP